MSERILRLGTRGSRLALWQAHWVRDAIKERLGREVELVILKTQGDKDQSKPVTQLGGVGVFVKELERALLAEEIDLAVHSLKDLPTDLPEGLCVAAYPVRKSPHECLIVHPEAVDRSAGPIPLVEGATVGTASLRRRALLLERRPDLSVQGIRGNVPTRVDKARTREVDAVMLAAAGIDRLELALEGLERFDLGLEEVLPAPGQGALAIEVREADREAFELLSQLDDAEAREATAAERELLHGIGAGCSVPLGTRAWREEEGLVLDSVLQVNPTDHAQVVLRRARVRAEHAAGAAALALRVLDHKKAETPTLDLAGKRVLVARDPARAAELVEAIERAGARASCYAPTRIEPVAEADPAAALEALPPGSWIGFASANAARQLAARVDLPALAAGQRIAAVGPATARALAEAGLFLDLLAHEGTGGGLAASLLARWGEGRPAVLLPAARGGRLELGEELRSAGCEVTRLELYASQPAPAPAPEELAVDAVLVASPSGARALLASQPQLSAKVVAIGPTTGAALEELGYPPAAVAESPTAAGLLHALAEALGG